MTNFNQENFEQKLLLQYSTSHLNSTEKVKFYYALKGRDGKSGILKQLNVEQLAKSVLLAEHHHHEDLQGFFKYWECPITVKKVFVERE